jgi:hypothetical protein
MTKRHKSGEQIALEEVARQQRITDLHDAVAVQIAILSELAHELIDQGLDDDARIARRIILELGRPADIVNRVRDALPHIDLLISRMRELGMKTLRKAVEGVKKVLVARCDVTLLDTRPIEPTEIPKDDE